MVRLPPRLFTRTEEEQSGPKNKRPRLFEGDRIRFPMEGIPPDLYSYIVEKMLYTDFSKFHRCNTGSARMCNSLPTNVELPFHTESISITESARGYRNREAFKSAEALAKCLPKNVHYFCYTLTINPFLWEMVKNYKFTAEKLRVYNEVAPSVLLEMLRKTKPTVLHCYELQNEVLSFAELKKLKDFTFTISEIYNDELLSLQMPTLTIWRCEISLTTVTKFLHQWLLGERTISHVEIGIMSGWTINQLVDELKRSEPIFSILPGETDSYWICKTEEHQNCIEVELRGGHCFLADGEKNCICKSV